MHKNSVIIKKAYGISNIELNTPMQVESIYKIGSVSKQFLATAIIILERNGVLTRYDSLPKFFGPICKNWQKVTIEHLLRHTAGLPREPLQFDPYENRPIKEYLIDAFKSQPLSAPGEVWSYSNLGYFAIAEIIQYVTGKSFNKFIQEVIFEPAQMEHTTASSSTDIVKGRVSSYLVSNGVIKNAGELRAIRPSGAFLSNAADLGQWIKILLNSKDFGFDLLQELSTPTRLNNGKEVPYGYGLYLGKINGHKFARHGGGLWFFRSEILIFSAFRLGLVVLANSKNADVTAIASDITEIICSELKGYKKQALNVKS